MSDAIRGTLFSVLSVGGTLGVRLASNVYMTRLLSPELYGQMALLVAVDVGLKMLSDVGSNYLVVNHPKGDERRFVDTVYTVEVVRGMKRDPNVKSCDPLQKAANRVPSVHYARW